MRTIILLITSLLFSISLSSQIFNHFGYGIEVNPKIVTQFDGFERPANRPSTISVVSATGNLYFELNNHYHLKSGISINLLNIDQTDFIFTSDCFLGNTNQIIDTGLIRTNYSLYYLGLPIENKINLSTGRNRPYIKVGGEFLFLVGQSGESVVHPCGATEQNVLDNYQPYPIIFQLDFGLGYEFRLPSAQTIYIEPNIEYTVDRIFEKQPFQHELIYNKIFNIGLVLGMRFE